MSDRTLPHHRILSSEAEKQAAERLDGLLENWFPDGYGENDYLSPLGRSIFIENFLLGLREHGLELVYKSSRVHEEQKLSAP